MLLYQMLKNSLQLLLVNICKRAAGILCFLYIYVSVSDVDHRKVMCGFYHIQNRAEQFFTLMSLPPSTSIAPY